LEDIQRKYQALFKPMQIVEKKPYILYFTDADHPLKGAGVTLMKSEDMPLDHDEMLKFIPHFYVRTEPGQLYGKRLVVHKVPLEDIVFQMSHTFRCEQHQVYVRYIQQEEVVDEGLFVYFHSNLNGDRLTELLSTMSGYHMSGR
jgi:hypothetical protein